MAWALVRNTVADTDLTRARDKERVSDQKETVTREGK